MTIWTQIGQGQVLQEDWDPDAFQRLQLAHIAHWSYQEGVLGGYREVVSQPLPGRDETGTVRVDMGYTQISTYKTGGDRYHDSDTHSMWCTRAHQQEKGVVIQ